MADAVHRRGGIERPRRDAGAALRPASDETAYPPIADYAAIGDCRSVALVSRQGSIDWLCLPDISSPSVFAALLDRRRGGRFAVRPVSPFATERRYTEGTNVLETVFTTSSGRVRVTDLVGLKVEGDARLDPEREILRIVEGLEGEVDVEILFQPRPDYGRASVRLSRRGTLGWACEHRGEILLLRGGTALEPVANGTSLRGCMVVRAGMECVLSLVYANRDILVLPPLEEAGRRLAETVGWWADWSGRCRYDGPYRAAVLRSALALKLLTYSQSGAVMAAATTSLPEAIGAGRNWDYRFCWLRDASTTLQVFFDLGYRGEGEAFLEWLLHSTRLTRPRLDILYDAFGRSDVRGAELDHLEGYRGSRPVRVGNDAVKQFQLDVYGSVVDGAFLFAERGGRLDYAEQNMLRQFGRIVCERWREPDNGIWEIGGPPRHYVHSKLMCWVALDRLVRLHEAGRLKVPADVYRRERDAIREAIETRGFDPARRCYVGVLDEGWLDAAVLTMARLGYRDARDPRIVSTLQRLMSDLGDGGLVRRYGDGYDRIPTREGAFGMCSFWTVELLALQGRIDEAHRLFQRVLAMGNDVGLLAEEFDPASGEALGNIPQAYTHAGLVSAALALCQAERRAAGCGSPGGRPC
ncbi:MAG TPA: glycoside hydrolase family 15 protein [Azospirillaceae bacterium]|nr:glycoside hydrolase family 15 protein [Azospirillaceae bacterium]